MIIIATHGHTGVEHLLFGSTAEKVVRKAPCPVLTLREPIKGFPVQQIVSSINEQKTIPKLEDILADKTSGSSELLRDKRLLSKKLR